MSFSPLLRHPDLQTVLPAFFRKVVLPPPRRERLELADGDFLDLDWHLRPDGDRGGRSAVAILSHGLEGSADRPYILGMVRRLAQLEVDSLAWNFRSCSGAMNRLPRLYSNNDTADLDAVVQRAVAAGYRRIVLVGFSMGGNVSLLYLGRSGAALPPEVCAAAAFSAPVDLADSAAQMARGRNRIYMRHFLGCLHRRIRRKMIDFPELLDDRNYHRLRDFAGFDSRYTAPLHGFVDAQDYWTRCSAAPLLAAIRVPVLLVNALDDPFLGAACYPQSRGSVVVKTPRFGGHLGFMETTPGGSCYSERLAAAFITRVLQKR